MSFSYHLRDIDFVASKPEAPRWRGRFFQWSLSVGVSSTQRVDRRIFVFSSGKRRAVVRYLWLKFLWDSLLKREFLLFLSIPEILEDPRKVAVLRLLAEGHSKRKIRDRLLQLELLLGIPQSSRERYISMRTTRLEIFLISRILRKVRKYSGYTKHYKDQGSLRPQSPASWLETTTESTYNDEREFSWYHYLSVGEVPLLGGVATFFLMSPEKDETEQTND